MKDLPFLFFKGHEVLRYIISEYAQKKENLFKTLRVPRAFARKLLIYGRASLTPVNPIQYRLTYLAIYSPTKLTFLAG